MTPMVTTAFNRSRPDCIDIGTQKQLFCDELIIEEMRGLERTLNQPVRYAGNPLMFPIHPWEGRLELYGTVLRDADGSFRMWYTGLGGMGVAGMGATLGKWAHLGFDPANLLYSYCYAVSKDGIFWERPNLGLVEYGGSKENNLLMLDAAGGNVCRDDRLPDPERRYKALFYEARDPGGTPNEGDGVSVAFSPDGLSWTKYQGNPVIRRASDSHRLLGWDDRHRAWVAYCRPTVHEGNPVRRIGRCTSDDFIHWNDPEEVLVPDERDPPGTQFYCMAVFRCAGLYIGQLHVYHTNPEEPHIRFYGTIDIQLAVSRDGIRWERVCDRAGFMENGPAGSDDAGEIYMANAPVEVGDELWFYYSPCGVEHGPTGRSGPINLAKLRLDGFVSVDAEAETGTLVTRPFRCEGGSLRINAAARGGEVSVAVLDGDGVQQDRFGKSDSALFDGDSVGHETTWRRACFDDLRGRVIRLKFYLRNARLYSFQQGPGQ